jgi:hypothetical protein
MVIVEERRSPVDINNDIVDVQIRKLPVDLRGWVWVFSGSRILDPDPYPSDPGSKPAQVTPTCAMH